MTKKENGVVQVSSRLAEGDNFKMIDLELARALGYEETAIVREIHDLQMRNQSIPLDDTYEFGMYWAYKSSKNIEKHLGIEQRKAKRKSKWLTDIGILIVRKHIDGNADNQTNWYAIDHVLLDDLYHAWKSEGRPIKNSDLSKEFFDKWMDHLEEKREDYLDAIIEEIEAETDPPSDNLSGGLGQNITGSCDKMSQGGVIKRRSPSKEIKEDIKNGRTISSVRQTSSEDDFSPTLFDQETLPTPYNKIDRLIQAGQAGKTSGKEYGSSRNSTNYIPLEDIEDDHVVRCILDMLKKETNKRYNVTHNHMEKLDSGYPDGDQIIESWANLYRLSPIAVRDYIKKEVPRVMKNKNMRLNVGNVIKVLTTWHHSRRKHFDLRGIAIPVYNHNDEVIDIDTDLENIEPWDPVNM